jgi:hypothetical protein
MLAFMCTLINKISPELSPYLTIFSLPFYLFCVRQYSRPIHTNHSIQTFDSTLTPMVPNLCSTTDSECCIMTMECNRHKYLNIHEHLPWLAVTFVWVHVLIQVLSVPFGLQQGIVIIMIMLLLQALQVRLI